MVLAVFMSQPLVIFLILVRVFILSPGFVLSGLYPKKKSIPPFNPLSFSKIGIQISSVAPG